MRTYSGNNALVMTGLARDFSGAYPFIQKYIINPYRINPSDIYINIWDDTGYWYPGDAQVSKSFYESGIVNESELRFVYPSAKIEIESFRQLEPSLAVKLEKCPEQFREDLNHSNYLVRGINLVSLFYKINKGIEMVPSSKYDRIIRTRLDFAPAGRINDFSTKSFKVLRQRNHLGLGTGDNLHVGTLEQHKVISRIIDEIPLLFHYTDKVLCPHLFIEAALKLNRIKYREIGLQYTTLHTPAGQYKSRNSAGEWVELQHSDYEKSQKPFRGK